MNQHAALGAVIALSLMFVTSVCLPVPHSGAAPVGGGPGSVSVQAVWGPNSTHIQHVITVVMENRDYDNYFGDYCLKIGPYCPSVGNGITPGTCVPNSPAFPTLGCTPPYDFTINQFTTADLPHDWYSGRAAWNNGSMDNFYLAESKGVLPFGHYNATTLAIYWDMAQEYAISDNLFAANLSYSLPNHWDLLGGQAPPISEQSYLRTGPEQKTYLNQSNSTDTVQDLLNGTNVTWKYYDFNLAPWGLAIKTGGSAYDYWNPMAARTESYTAPFASHFVARDTFVQDVTNGTLPQLSWVIPSENISEHPGFNISWGESWVAQLVDLVEASPAWSSTAIFIVWDDYGGWYDHVAPPTVLGSLLSFRSPAIVISPYAKQNYISHTFLDFYSLLRYDEWQFGLGCLTMFDCTAPMPFDFFDFNQTARLPLLFPTAWDQASYPLHLMTGGPTIGGALRTPPCISCVTTVPQFWSAPPSHTTDPALGD